jgi:colanic acid biosynthesis glycosyl transferase WcaI
VGDGAQREKLQAASAAISNVRFLSFFPASKIPSVLAAADAHLITIKRGLEGVVVPSKIFGILAAGKPIVAVAPEECDVVSIGRQRGFSIAADPDDPAQFVQRVRELASDRALRERMEKAAAAVAPEYERNRELEKLVGIIEEARGAAPDSKK